MKNNFNDKFIKVYSTPNPGEISLIKSLLDSQAIEYYIKGEHFASLYGSADGLSSMDIMIREDYLETAEELLREFIKPKGDTRK